MKFLTLRVFNIVISCQAALKSLPEHLPQPRSCVHSFVDLTQMHSSKFGLYAASSKKTFLIHRLIMMPFSVLSCHPVHASVIGLIMLHLKV